MFTQHKPNKIGAGHHIYADNPIDFNANVHRKEKCLASGKLMYKPKIMLNQTRWNDFDVTVRNLSL